MQLRPSSLALRTRCSRGCAASGALRYTLWWAGASLCARYCHAAYGASFSKSSRVYLGSTLSASGVITVEVSQSTGYGTD